MEFDMSGPWETVQRLANGFVAFLPRLVAALLIVAVFYLVAKLVRMVIHRSAARRREHPNLEKAVGRIVQAGLVLLGLLVAAAAAFPTFTPGDLVSALGIGSIAAGFAFKDILQNFLAGLLILLTKPFLVGDQIVFGTYEGTVEDIQTRATFLKTYDGRRVVIPNADLFTNSVTVNTAFPKRRMEYDIGIGYGDDVARAKQLILEVLDRAEGVLPDPKADVIVVALDESAVNLRARWWTSAYIADVLIGQDRVLGEVKRSLQAAGIDIPFPTRQILFHDQTEATDGDRRRQREGWPAGPTNPPPRSIAGAIQGLDGARPGGASEPAR